MNRQVIEKEQRLGTLHEHIINVHRNQINAYGVELFYLAG
jgi:hypothetical protein